MDPLTLIFLVLLLAGISSTIFFGLRARRRRREAEPVVIAEDAPFNTLAIVAFVVAFFATIPAIVCGHIALRQVEVRRERGRGLATAALVIGYTVTALVFIVVPVTLYYVTQGTWNLS
ncbi:MAG: DUF4190 domain-containing protein [Actinobacteria bacterium]|nr:DUF4190 domain-containing protein [Actinomycetota bacterium]MBU1608745.1 DUF4190 domain-containing protein [Actinomycetota bacterium]MBU2316518.1 DUF4190 domain-containing protein [Actinomycetota bacterium]MBU2386290.1 DUF4190 domain-containing protein [Actinomycetota bacterium]